VLVADLHDAAHHHVVDDRGIEVVPLRKGLQGLRRQIGRMPPDSLPFRLPPGVRTASTMTALASWPPCIGFASPSPGGRTN